MTEIIQGIARIFHFASFVPSAEIAVGFALAAMIIGPKLHLLRRKGGVA
ncbi:MAG: hypothetical protein JST28_17650 [Acidobacteria bacterium]|nr:hypothetical protein [Acidobacteriota bacterium]